MIIIQDSNKDVIGVYTTIAKALRDINTPKYSFDYIRAKLKNNKYRPIKYKDYTISKWKITTKQ